MSKTSSPTRLWGWCSSQIGLAPPRSQRAVEKLCPLSLGPFQGKRQLLTSDGAGVGGVPLAWTVWPLSLFSVPRGSGAAGRAPNLSWRQPVDSWAKQETERGEPGWHSKQTRQVWRWAVRGHRQLAKRGHPLQGYLGPAALSSAPTAVSKALVLPAQSPRQGRGPRCFGTSVCFCFFFFYLYNRNSA